MSITSLPLVSMLRERMQWHQARQKVLAENVSNASTPGFQPRDLTPFRPSAPAMTASASVGADRTDPMHLSSSSSSGPGERAARRFETSPSGNAVSLDDEMLKVAENQSEYQLATTLYQKSLALLRTAAGAKGA